MRALFPKVPGANSAFRIINVNLIDGCGGPIQRDASVLIVNGRISDIGVSSSTNRFSDDVVTVDADGAYLLPGFIDAHVHFGVNLELDSAYLQHRLAVEAAFDTAANLRNTLMAGITTARDLGGIDAGYRRAVADGKILGPRMHIAIAPLSPTGGHTDFCLPNGQNVDPGLAVVDPIVDTDDELRQRVRHLVRDGADVIKVCTTGGVSSPTDTPDDIGITDSQVAIIVEEMAKRSGQPVAAHAQGREGIHHALRGGITSVEHGYEIDEAGIEYMKENNVYLVPTLSAALRIPDPAVVPDYLYEKKVVWSATAKEHVTRAIQAGVKIAMGTDSGVCPHGQNLKELGHLVDLGLSPIQAIQAGTVNAAELLRLDEQIGTAEKGKVADLVLTRVNPLNNIHGLANPDSIIGIIQGGHVVKDTESILSSAAVSEKSGEH